MSIKNKRPYKLYVDEKTRDVYFYSRNYIRSFFARLLKRPASQTLIVVGPVENLLILLVNIKHIGETESQNYQIDGKNNLLRPEIKRDNTPLLYCRVVKNDHTIIVNPSNGAVSLLKPRRLVNIYNSIIGDNPQYTKICCGHIDDIIEELEPT